MFAQRLPVFTERSRSLAAFALYPMKQRGIAAEELAVYHGFCKSCHFSVLKFDEECYNSNSCHHYRPKPDGHFLVKFLHALLEFVF